MTSQERGESGARRGPAPDSLSRRAFLKGAGGVTATGLVGSQVLGQPADAAVEPGAASLAGRVELTLTVNGEPCPVEVEPRTTLLHALRHHADPPRTGTKEVCDMGNCGACTVLLDGEPVCSCLTLAADAVGHEVTTIEGLAAGDELSPLQEAFCEHDAMMCGFCTPGFTMSIHACLEKNPAASLDEIKWSCSGNICRCGTYPHVFEAALSVARQGGGGR